MLYRFECAMIKYNLNLSWSIMNMRKCHGIKWWNSVVEPGAYESNVKLDCSKRKRYQKQCYIWRLRLLNDSSMFVDAWKVVTYMDLWLWCLDWASLCPGVYEYMWPQIGKCVLYPSIEDFLTILENWVLIHWGVSHNIRKVSFDPLRTFSQYQGGELWSNEDFLTEKWRVLIHEGFSHRVKVSFDPLRIFPQSTV